MLVDAADKLSKEAADSLWSFDIGFSETAGRHPAEMVVILDEGDTAPEPRGTDRRGYSPWCASIHDDVIRLAYGDKQARQ